MEGNWGERKRNLSLWSRTKFKGRKMLISFKPLTKYVIIIYALGSVLKKSGV